MTLTIALYFTLGYAAYYLFSRFIITLGILVLDNRALDFESPNSGDYIWFVPFFGDIGILFGSIFATLFVMFFTPAAVMQSFSQQALPIVNSIKGKLIKTDEVSTEEGCLSVVEDEPLDYEPQTGAGKRLKDAMSPRVYQIPSSDCNQYYEHERQRD